MLLALLVMLLCIALVFAWRTYGPGWKSLAGKGLEWEMKELEDGRTIEFSTTFFIGDTADLSDYYFVAGGTQVLQVLINHKIVMDKNPYSYYPQNNDSTNIEIHKYYAFQNHYFGDEVIHSAIKPGYNSLRIWTTHEGLRSMGPNGWKLVAYNDAFSTRYKNEKRSKGVDWHPSPDIAVMYLDVPEHLIPDDPKVRGRASMKLGGNQILSSDVLLETRGRSSQAFDKKQFNMRFVEEGSKERKQLPIASMAPASDWVLYGPFVDLSQIRNNLAYSISEALGHYAPKSVPIELFINNNYRGLYFLMEKVQSLPGRVDIRFDPSDSLNSDNNAFLVLVNPAAENDLILYPSHQSFILEDPIPGIEPEKWYIKRTTDQLGVITRAIMDEIPNLDEAIDFASFADYILVNEIAKNIDAYRLSTFFHKLHEQDNPRLMAGPVWDFNLAFGNSLEGKGTEVSNWVFEQPEIVDSMWITLFNHPKFHPFLVDRYKKLRSGLLSENSINQRIDSIVNQISAVLPNNLQRYGWPEEYFWPYESIPPDHSSEIQNIKTFIAARLTWMDGELK